MANDALVYHLNGPLFHLDLLMVGYSQGDDAATQTEIRWFQQKAENEQELNLLGRNASARGRLREAENDWRRAEALAARGNPAQAAFSYAQDQTLNKALAGVCDFPLTETVSNSLMAIGAALCGRVSPEGTWTNELSDHMPIGTLWKEIYFPSVKAAGALHSGNAQRVLEELHSAPSYDRVYPYIPYLRGLALLRQKDGHGAEAEFRKIVERPGSSWFLSCPQFHSLSRLGLARAQAMTGDLDIARATYKDLLEYWRDADSDYKPAIEARREYQALPKQ